MKRLCLLTVLITLVATVFAGSLPDQKKLFSEKSIKKTMKKAAFWQLDNPKHEQWDWTNGAFFAGVFAAYETTESNKIMKALLKMGETNEWKAGPRLHHADDHAICQTYIDVYRIKKDQKMIQPFIETMNEFIATPYPTKLPMQPITWWWCDALFMGPPAFVKLGIILNDDKYLKLNDTLFKECYDLLYDKEEHLFARDIRYKWDQEEILKEANGKKVFWSRGNGWVMGGLVRVLEELPKNYPARGMYEKVFQEMATRIIELQQKDGLWRASLLDPNSYPGGEASGSGFYTYALAWGINNGLLNKESFLPAVEKAWIGLNSLIQSDGHVGWTQPIGADPRANFAAESWEVYGTGAFLLAGSEIIKLER